MSFFDLVKPTVLRRRTKLLSTTPSLTNAGRGADANEDQRAQVDKLAVELTKLNPTKNLLGPELSAKWKLLYTTSDSILGTSRPPFLRPFGDIYQTIDVEKLTAKNQETIPFFGGVDAELTPATKNKVNVQFKTFYIFGVIPVQAPESAKGELTITYLDEDLRISRGNRGNLFILSK